jgi:hypothetical protein
MRTRHTLRILCWLGAAICFGVLLIPGVRTVEKAEEKTTTIRMGLPFSPWFSFEEVRNETRTGDPSGNPGYSSSISFRSSRRIELMSWSMCSFLVTIGLLVAARYLRPSGKSMLQDPKTSPPGK